MASDEEDRQALIKYVQDHIEDSMHRLKGFTDLYPEFNPHALALAYNNLSSALVWIKEARHGH